MKLIINKFGLINKKFLISLLIVCVVVFGIFIIFLSKNYSFRIPAQENVGKAYSIIDNTLDELTLEGRISIMAFDDFDNPANSRLGVFLNYGDSLIELEGVDHWQIKPGSLVRVTGTKQNNKFITTESRIQQLRFDEIPGPEFNLGEQETLVLIGEYGDTPFGSTINEVYMALFGPKPSMNDYYIENSYGQTWFTGENIYGSFYLGENLPGECGSCWCYNNLWLIENDLIAAADPYVDFTQYKRIIFLIGLRDGCSSGYSSVGHGIYPTPDGDAIQSRAYVSFPSPEGVRNVLFHEMRHSLGSADENYVVYCGNDLFGEFHDNCELFMYANPFMEPYKHISASIKRKLGWFSEENWIVSDTGTYTLTPLSIPFGLKEIIIPKETQDITFPGFPEFPGYPHLDTIRYSIEYRAPLGYDNDTHPHGIIPTITGDVIIILEMLPSNPFFSWWTGINPLIDTTPDIWYENPRWTWNAPLKAGEGYHDNYIGQTINVLSTDLSGAQVELIKDPDGCRRNFALFQHLYGIPVGQRTFKHRFLLRNRDYIECTPSVFDISVKVPANWVAPVPFQIHLNPWEQIEFDIYIESHEHTPNGAYILNFSAKNSRHFYFESKLDITQWIGSPIIYDITSTTGVTTAKIIWHTDRNANGQIEYGLSSGNYIYNQNTEQPADGTYHSVNLIGLQSDTTYYYRVRSCNYAGCTHEIEEKNFRTKIPSGGSPLFKKLPVTIAE